MNLILRIKTNLMGNEGFTKTQNPEENLFNVALEMKQKSNMLEKEAARI